MISQQLFLCYGSSVVKRPGASVPNRYKKNENVRFQVFSSTGGTGDPVNPVLDAYGHVISTMQKKRTE